jgi:hypothetical protein
VIAVELKDDLLLATLHLLHSFFISTPSPRTMSTTPSEIWNNILKDNVGKDDPLWKEYLDKAAVFDVRMVDEWNKIVDVLLVYVGILTTCTMN